MVVMIAAGTFLAAGTASADWRSGRVVRVAIGYEGSIVAFQLEGHKNSLPCTCPTYWTGYICLNRARESFKEEYAFLLSAKARDVVINVNIDETTCKVTATYES
jgi:hypothetical protein